jgi:hypothetical protein
MPLPERDGPQLPGGDDVLLARTHAVNGRTQLRTGDGS